MEARLQSQFQVGLSRRASTIARNDVVSEGSRFPNCSSDRRRHVCALWLLQSARCVMLAMLAMPA
eukprot:6651517-Alexandrium_andersonii.AAC.1